MRLSVQLQAHKLPMSHLVLVYDGYDAIPWFRIHFKMGLEYQPYKWPREKYFPDNTVVLQGVHCTGTVVLDRQIGRCIQAQDCTAGVLLRPH
jgi:hypothetical protein